MITAIVVGILALHCSAQNITLKQLLHRAQRTLNPMHSWQKTVVMGSVGVLFASAFGVLYKVSRNRGKFSGDNKFIPVRVIPNGTTPQRFPCDQILDTSLLDDDGNGIAYFSPRKPNCSEFNTFPFNHDGIAAAQLLAIPFETIGRVVYNLLRFCIVPFYILECMVREAGSDNPLRDKRKFKFKDIPKQMALSLYWALSAPVHGVALMLATVYSFVQPVGGRKLGYRVMQHRLGEVDLSESLWAGTPASKAFRFEGGGGPDTLGHWGSVVTGCWFPWGVATFENGEVTEARSFNGKYTYTIDMQIPKLHQVEITAYTKPWNLDASSWGINGDRVAANVTGLNGDQLLLWVNLNDAGIKAEFLRNPLLGLNGFAKDPFYHAHKPDS